jgi:DNA helicase II / ATP-dependent DNA helicase PcrA
VKNSIVLTDEQIKICKSLHSRILVEANAGAAKTTTAALKIKHLVASGVDPRKIVALSYSQSGVTAYHEAFRRVGMDVEVARSIKVGTFEDFCASRLFKLEGIKVDRPYKPEQVRDQVLQAITEARILADENYPNEFALGGTGRFDVEGLLRQFAQIKGSMVVDRADEYFNFSPSCVAAIGYDFTIMAIYRAYENLRCRSVGKDGEQIQFRYMGDSIYDLAQILVADDPYFTPETNPLRLGLEAIILDEMHDTNWAMFSVLKALLEYNEGSIFLGVGDRDQVIHTENGADSYFMGKGFDVELGEAQRRLLTKTFRFGEAISKPLCGYSQKPYLVDSDFKSQVKVKRTNTAADIFVIIRDLLANRQSLPILSFSKPLAVLLRHPSAAVDLEYVLLENNCSYETIGFTTFLERPEVLFVRMILSAAVSQKNQYKGSIFQQAKLATWEFIGGELPHKVESGESTEKIVVGATQENFFAFILLALLKHTKNKDACEQVLAAMELASSDDISLLSKAIAALNIKTLAQRVFVNQDSIEDTEKSMLGLLNSAKGYSSITAFLDRMHYHDYNRSAKKATDKPIILSTIEDAKGLEFEHVIIPNMNKDSFDGQNGDDRNLFYVAASRARHTLTLTYENENSSSYLKHFPSPGNF